MLKLPVFGINQMIWDTTASIIIPSLIFKCCYTVCLHSLLHSPNKSIPCIIFFLRFPEKRSFGLPQAGRLTTVVAGTTGQLRVGVIRMNRVGIVVRFVGVRTKQIRVLYFYSFYIAFHRCLVCNHLPELSVFPSVSF